MMYEDEIKHKHQLDKLQCSTCLSIGRRLIPLGKHVDMLKKIAHTGFWKSCNIETVEICWECTGALIKMAKFQNQVLKVTKLLEMGQAYLYGTLSNLTTVIFNETSPNTVYLTQPNEASHTDTKPETIDIKSDFSHISDTIDNDTIDNDTTDNIDWMKTEFVAQKPVKLKKNRWAQKRALLNKKPKFKKINKQEIFRKVKISPEELTRCIEKERDSESYKLCKFKCRTCVLQFKNCNCLLNHAKTHHSKRAGPYICDICHTRTSKKPSLSAHIRSHYHVYECTICAYICRQETQRRTHARAHRIALQCVKCTLKFGSRRDFFKHYKEWHEKFICDYCGVSFKMRYCIKDHIRKQHSLFECKHCDKTFSRYNGLWLHNKVCHSESSRGDGAYCVECDRRYPDIYRYRWHLNNSARHRARAKTRVPCPDCHKVFTKKIYMKDHYDLVHLKKYKYRCEQCDKNYLRNADLVQHKKRIHEGILPPKNKICSMCGRGFTTNKILNNHVRTHTGERPFACARCPAAFAQRVALVQHCRARHA